MQTLAKLTVNAGDAPIANDTSSTDKTTTQQQPQKKTERKNERKKERKKERAAERHSTHTQHAQSGSVCVCAGGNSQRVSEFVSE